MRRPLLAVLVLAATAACSYVFELPETVPPEDDAASPPEAEPTDPPPASDDADRDR